MPFLPPVFTRPSNTFSKAFKKVLEGLVARIPSYRVFLTQFFAVSEKNATFAEKRKTNHKDDEKDCNFVPDAGCGLHDGRSEKEDEDGRTLAGRHRDSRLVQ